MPAPVKVKVVNTGLHQGVDRLLQHPAEQNNNEAIANLPEDQYSLIVTGNGEGFRLAKDFSATGCISFGRIRNTQCDFNLHCTHPQN